MFVQESQLRKSTRPRPASPRSLHIDPRSPSTRRRRVCSTAWRPAYAVAAASCRWPRLLVPVAAFARPGGRVSSLAWRETRTTSRRRRRAPKLTRTCPRRGEEEDRQGAFFYLSLGRATRRACSRTRRRDARAPVSSAPISSAPISSAPVSSAPSPQARAMIEYHKCRVSSFSNWARYRCRNQIFTGRDLPRIRTGQGRVAGCLLYTSPSPRDKRQSRMPSSA